MKTDKDPDPSNATVIHSHSRQPAGYTDREMWIAIRSGILGVVKAIDTFARDKPLAMAIRPALLRISTAIELRWELKNHKVN